MIFIEQNENSNTYFMIFKNNHASDMGTKLF